MIRFSTGKLTFLAFLMLTSLLNAGCGTENPFSRGPEVLDDGATLPMPGETVSFSRDVVPILSTCESCHASGAGGWTYDGVNNAHGSVRQVIDLNDPEQSALLVKGSGGDSHGGGRLFSPSSQEYQVLLNWIEQGGANN